MMEIISRCHVIVSTKVSATARVILAVREDGGGGKTYITAAAPIGQTSEWDHGRYFTAQAGLNVEADVLGAAMEDHAARVLNYGGPVRHPSVGMPRRV